MTHSETPIVRFTNVSKIYGEGQAAVHALRQISFTIEEGEFCVLLGASGAGKTTLLNLLGGMDTVSEGEIVFDGKLVSSLTGKALVDYRRYDVGFVFQFYNLIPNLTARENVEIAAMLCKDPVSPEEALEMVGLSERMDNFPSELSGGEQQRVAIARAVAKNPRLLLCDEPTGALDFETGKSVLRLLYEFSRSHHITVVVITHNQAIASMADHIIRIRSGRIESDALNEHPTPIDEIVW